MRYKWELNSHRKGTWFAKQTKQNWSQISKGKVPFRKRPSCRQNIWLLSFFSMQQHFFSVYQEAFHKWTLASTLQSKCQGYHYAKKMHPYLRLGFFPWDETLWSYKKRWPKKPNNFKSRRIADRQISFFEPCPLLSYFGGNHSMCHSFVSVHASGLRDNRRFSNQQLFYKAWPMNYRNFIQN